MLLAEAIHAFQLDDELLPDHQVGDVFPHVLALVANRKRHLGPGAYATQCKFPEQGALIDLLQESGPEHICNLKS
jgi:hypothetical protein